MLAVVFLRGFKEAIGVAADAAEPYLLLNLVVLGAALGGSEHPTLVGLAAALEAKGDSRW